MSTSTVARRRKKRTSSDRVSLGRGRKPQARKLRDAKDALYRQHIIEVAERLFAKEGFAATRMQDIAAAAGVSLAKLYEFHASKDELYRGVLIARDREMLGQVLERWSGTVQAPESIEQVLLLMETHLYFLLEHPDYLRLLLREGYAWYSRAAQPTSEEKQMFDRGVAQISMVLGWGIREGFFSACDHQDQARLMLTAQQTRLANWVMGAMKLAPGEVIAQVQADFVRICCHPVWVARLLTPDGVGLSDATRARIDQLRGTYRR